MVINLFKHIFLVIYISVQLLALDAEYKPIKYKLDDINEIAIDKKNPNSHLKIYLPSIPYSYIMRLINGTLVRLDSSAQGWEYFLAFKHEKVDDLTYDFWLRKDVKFQDGTIFNADSVVQNFEYFQKGAFTYTDIHNSLKNIEKLDEYKIRIHLNKPYGMLLNDLARINLYTSEYLKKYSWSNNIIGENTKASGPYGSGPYILSSGYAIGLKQSEELVLTANPYYFEKDKPYIQTITIFTKLPIKDVIHKITKEEGELDIAIIPFNKKTEIVNSKFAKLVSKESSFNISVHFNLMNENSKLQNQKIRQAMNQAIDQKRLIKFAYKNEGIESPFPLSSNSYYARNISKKYIENPKIYFTEDEMHKLLNGLSLKVITQDRFISLWKGMEYQLNRYGVKLNFDITSDESYVLSNLLTNRKNVNDWDLLMWGNDNWYGHPWSSFFNLYSKNEWSAIKSDDILDDKFRKLFGIENTNPEFQIVVNDILEYIYDKAYMIRLPSPNLLLALNKEVSFDPSSVAILRLWDAKISPYHWSVRGNNKLPESRKEFILPKRISNDE